MPLVLFSLAMGAKAQEARNAAGSRAAPPNVVLIYTDDQGYGDCRSLNPDCGFPTPNLDRLAGQGMTLTDAHSASGVCSPSRYALLTGRYAWRTRLKRGVLGADTDCLIENGRWTIASVLKTQGYSTAVFGKWHLGLQIPGSIGKRDWSARVTDGPLQKGFDQFYGIPASMNFGVLTWFDGDRATEPASMWTRKKFPPSEIETKPLDYRMAPPFDGKRQRRRDIETAASFVDEHVLRITTEKTVEYLESRGDAPFFAYVALTSPHLPHCTAPEFRGKSGMGNYGDFMLETDHRVGQILAALDRTGAAKNTLVLFTSDNGPENNYQDWIQRYGHHAAGMWRGGKRDLYEGGHRVPFFVRWPGVVEPGSRSDALIGQVDVLATIAEILGADLPPQQADDSRSFLAVLRGKAGGRESLVHHSGAGHFGYRSGRWKLVFLPPKRTALCELYDLVADPKESVDLAERRPEVVRRLTAELTEVVHRGGADEATWWPQLTWIPKPEKGGQGPAASAKPAAVGVRQEVYKTIGDVELRVTMFEPVGHRPGDSRPAAVFFFGGGWNGGTTKQFEPHARYLAARGMVGMVADYRVKSRHGTTPFECVADGKSAVRWIRANARRLGVDPNRIAAGGGSAGGHVAAATGVVPGLDEPGEDAEPSARPNALLLFNPVFDNGPGGYGHARVKDRYAEISPLHNIRKGAPPTVVFLGTNDNLIPVATAEAYRDKMAAVGARCDLHLYERQPHGFFNQSRSPRHYYLTVTAMDAFLASLGWLTGKPTLAEPKAGK